MVFGEENCDLTWNQTRLNLRRLVVKGIDYCLSTAAMTQESAFHYLASGCRRHVLRILITV